MAVTISRPLPNCTVLTLGAVSVVFSYDSCVGFTDDHGAVPVLNSDFDGFSKTTQRHLGATGLKGAGLKAGGEEFADLLARAVARGVREGAVR